MTMLIYAKPMTKPRKLTVDWAPASADSSPVRFAFLSTEAPTEDEVYRAAFTAMNEYSYEPREDVKLIAQVAIRTNVRLKTARSVTARVDGRGRSTKAYQLRRRRAGICCGCPPGISR